MSKIKVALRVRPLSSRERDENYPIVVEVANNSAYITDIRVPEKPSADSRQRFRQFDFDHAFWLTDCCEWGASQEEVYNEMAPALEKSILQGYNACLLAYGQSGTGKTHTMLGTKADPGLIPRLCHSLWEKLRQGRENSSFRMEVSFMEIYREKVRDLLTPDKPLKLREHPQNGPHVQDLTRVEVTEKIGLVDLLWEGERRRAIGTTGSNRRSSRSHAIWTLYLSYRDGPDLQNLITNQVHLVDLAGSEKADLIATKNLLAEGADINRSLVSLGNVISSLAEKLQYIPYRDSALTWLLKDSLGGNANTSIIITASPSSVCHAQTLNSLRFAQRARLVENKPQVNLTACPGSRSSESYIASIFDIRRDISRLANILKVAQNNGGILRGLTPRNGWNRLITAIESWNHVDERQSQTRSSSTETSTASTMTTNSSVKSLDVMVQPRPEQYKKPADLTYEDARSCTSASVPTSPCKKNNNNNLSSTPPSSISSSSSIKCLTWSQPEVASVPHLGNSESEEEFTSPPQTPKVHHLKYIIPVHFPHAHNIEGEARVSEKIHGTCSDLPEPQRASLTCTPTALSPNNLLVREQLPTLVNPQKLDVFEDSPEESSSASTTNNSPSGDCGDISSSSPMFLGACDSERVDESFSENLDLEPLDPRHFVLARGTGRKRTHRAPPRIKEFSCPKPEELYLFESTDEGEFSDCLEVELNQSGNKNYRTVDFEKQVQINDTPTPPFTSLEYYSSSGTSSSGGRSGKSGKVSKRSQSRSSSSSSSSYESLVLQKTVKPVKIVENSVIQFPDDHCKDVSPDDFKVLEKRVTAISFNEAIVMDEKLGDEAEAEETGEDDELKTKPLDGSSQTAFQNFYRRELRQLDAIGKQIKSLQTLAQRYDVLKPYLKKIEELHNQDFTQPDPEVDPLIEHCSGWNVDIEFRKVQNEVLAISKILKNNPGIKLSGGISRRDSSSASNHSSHRTSSTSITTSGDSYSVTDPNSRRGSNASTFDLPNNKPNNKFPSLISTLTISSDLDSSISLSAPNSSLVSFNVSQSVSQPDVSTSTPTRQSLHYQHKQFNIPPEISHHQPPSLHFDYSRRKELPPPWTPHSPPTQPAVFQYENNPGFYPMDYAPPANPYYYPTTSPSYNNFHHPEPPPPQQHWRASTYNPVSPPENKAPFFNSPYSSMNGEAYPQQPQPAFYGRYNTNGVVGSKNGFSPGHNNNNYSSPQQHQPQQPPNPHVWSPVNSVNYSRSSPPNKINNSNGMKIDPQYGYHHNNPQPQYQQQQQQQHSPPEPYHGYGKTDFNFPPQHHPNISHHQSYLSNSQPMQGSSPFRSLSLEGDFANLSTSSSFCKSCAMEFCSCPESLSSKVPSSDYIPNKVSPVQVKGQSSRPRPTHLRSVFGSYNSQFSP